MPKVSVIIPVYNDEKYVAKAIESVLSQTCEDYEIIVVNDGSTDNSEAEILKFSSRIIYHKQCNKGRGAARNAALKKASGEYIAFLDADDEWLSHKLELQVSYLDKNPDVGLVYTDASFHSEDEEYLGTRLQNYIAFEGDVFPYLIRTNFFTTSTVVIRRECLEKVGVFDPSLKRAQDYDLWLRIALYYRFGFIKGQYTRYHRISVFKLETQIETHKCCLRILKKLGREYPKQVKKLGGYFTIGYRDYYQTLGYCYLKENNYLQAAGNFKKALAFYPQAARLKEITAITNYLAGKHNLARKLIRQALEVEPFNSKMHFYLGCSYVEDKKWRLAQKSFLAAVRSLIISSRFPEALNNLGLTCVAQGELAEAAHWFWNALNQQPDYLDAGKNLKLAQAGVARIDSYSFTHKLFGRIEHR